MQAGGSFTAMEGVLWFFRQLSYFLQSSVSYVQEAHFASFRHSHNIHGPGAAFVYHRQSFIHYNSTDRALINAYLTTGAHFPVYPRHVLSS
jgi:hypothetical protein